MSLFATEQDRLAYAIDRLHVATQEIGVALYAIDSIRAKEDLRAIENALLEVIIQLGEGNAVSSMPQPGN